MLADLDHEIAIVFLIRCGKSGFRIAKQAGQLATAQADVNAVIGQADIGCIRQYHQIVCNNAGFL